MNGFPDVVLLTFDPDFAYAERLLDALHARDRHLVIAAKAVTEIDPIPPEDVALHILLLGPDAPAELAIAGLGERLRQAIVGERLIGLAHDRSRLPEWNFVERFADPSDWDGDPDPAMLERLVHRIASHQARLRIEAHSDIIADASNILRPDGSIGLNRYLFLTMNDIEWSVRTANVLKNENIIYVGDLVQRTEAEVLRMPNMGRKSLNEIKEVLSSMDLSLGLSPVGWPPENIEQELDRIEAAKRAAELQQKPGGATFAVNDDRLVINAAGDDSDREAAERPITRQMHEEIQRKARAFAAAARRLDNQIGWGGIGRLGARLEELLAVPTEDIPDVLGYLYPSALELGSFLEMDNALLAGSDSYATPLDSEVRRPLDDLVRTFAPWLRGFPSVRQMDDDAGRFLVRQVDLLPTQAIIWTARGVDLISEEDAATLHALVEAAARGEFQGEKAAGRVILSVRNMVYLGASLVGSFLLGSVSSDFATKSILVQRAGTMLASAEGAILQLVADLPHDLRLSIKDLVHESLILPEAPFGPSENDPPNRASGVVRRNRWGQGG